jgi:hypothetical protein
MKKAVVDIPDAAGVDSVVEAAQKRFGPWQWMIGCLVSIAVVGAAAGSKLYAIESSQHRLEAKGSEWAQQADRKTNERIDRIINRQDVQDEKLGNILEKLNEVSGDVKALLRSR